MNKLVNICTLLLTFLFIISCEKNPNKGLPVDGDGNIYDTVVIGTQVWLKENLKTGKFQNGVPLKLVTDPNEWSKVSVPAYCYYGNTEGLKNPYGAIYNWTAARLATLCPVGWRTPTIEEWEIMINYLGGESIAGGKLKEEGLVHWYSPNTGATNESGFSALPGGDRNRYGSFDFMGQTGSWWTSSPSYDNSSWMVSINKNYASIKKVNFPVVAGYSVRCLKNN